MAFKTYQFRDRQRSKSHRIACERWENPEFQPIYQRAVDMLADRKELLLMFQSIFDNEDIAGSINRTNESIIKRQERTIQKLESTNQKLESTNQKLRQSEHEKGMELKKKDQLLVEKDQLLAEKEREIEELKRMYLKNNK